MIVVNFSHPITAANKTEIEQIVGQPVKKVIDVPTHFDDDQDFAPQVTALMATTKLSAEAWQTLPLLVNLPAYSPVVAVLLVHLHGMTGHFPAILRLRPTGGVPPAFEVTEVLDLNLVRAHAREER